MVKTSGFLNDLKKSWESRRLSGFGVERFAPLKRSNETYVIVMAAHWITEMTNLW